MTQHFEPGTERGLVLVGPPVEDLLELGPRLVKFAQRRSAEVALAVASLRNECRNVYKSEQNVVVVLPFTLLDETRAESC